MHEPTLLDWRDGLLIVFFTTIGLSADIRTLATGGRMLVVLTLVAVANVWLQNGVGIAVADLLGANPAIGLLAGSIGFSGGHGTAIAWAPTLQSTFNLSSALEMGTAVATFGLVAGGVLGGPLGRFLIRRHRLEPGSASPTSVGFGYAEEGRLKLDVNGMLESFSSSRSQSASGRSSTVCSPIGDSDSLNS